ncbi:MAG: low specificity L-threonine aldolase [Burkholderiaceae bacterium]|nr:low specificity L-threonine aldolase [Burkholderiaceae bacterium]
MLCHAQSHIVTDESTAPEFFTGGARAVGIAHDDAKLTAAALREHLAHAGRDQPHNPQAGAVSIAQATECGLVYTPDEVAALADCAHAHAMALHMDGARFANAVVSLQCSPAELSWRAGVDILTLGASKNGCWAAEAIVVFRKDLAAGMEHRRKRAGHLLAKGRLLGAQMLGWLRDGHWLDLARHANGKAAQLARRIAEVPGVSLVWPVQANELFLLMPRELALRLQGEGAEFYEWYVSALPPGQGARPDQMFVRLVCSFATTDEQIDTFVNRARFSAPRNWVHASRRTP